MQPSWRGKTLSRNIPTDANWGSLLCGGANGLLTVILSLAWWMQAASKAGDVESSSVWIAIEEVSWALKEMGTTLAGNRGRLAGKKRSSEGDVDVGSVAKRCEGYRILIISCLILL